MDQIIVTGGERLSGDVWISGAKNAALAVVPSVLCAGAPCVIDNLPMIEDIRCYIDILERMGARVEILDKNTLRIDPTTCSPVVADFDSAKKIRASYYVLGAMLGRFGYGAVALPGGDNFGPRPIDFHVKGFEALGAEVYIEHGVVYARADRLRGAHIYLDFASVGATVNIMFAAVNAKGMTVIENAAKEPHVVDVANFLNYVGANIKGAGTGTIRIMGGDALRGGDYTIIPDMIEAGTFMAAAAITGGDVTVHGVIPKHMDSISAKMREMKCTVDEGEDTIRVRVKQPLSPVNVKTQVYPGFPTDMQPQMCALLSTINGTSIVKEMVTDNRFQYISELERMGARVTVDGRQAIVDGGPYLTGAEVTAFDLRGGVALITAGLAADGQTRLNSASHVDRGYEAIDAKLSSLGANISREAVEVKING